MINPYWLFRNFSRHFEIARNSPPFKLLDPAFMRIWNNFSKAQVSTRVACVRFANAARRF
ncbi:hypothetical protein PLANPX_5264 [Lacipirellula parvula]|uniref:Uncharacterized protein n=1 Tax=Lacipirellula parvula TaxID=2650471 RepID=A0A5K7XHX7_9BACT|nr:hypothetical protein PLANPX_5264 [Lacipirellula parvula]